jgi:outer membrane protein TolC
MMSETFYIEQAESCARAADAAPLANQRETLLRSRSVWLGLAAREEMIRIARAERERAKEQAND